MSLGRKHYMRAVNIAAEREVFLDTPEEFWGRTVVTDGFCLFFSYWKRFNEITFRNWVRLRINAIHGDIGDEEDSGHGE